MVIQPTGPTAVFDTSMGRVTCKLFDKEAPIAVANFIGLAEGSKDWTDPVTKETMHGKPFYNGTTFHRVIPTFMIQGGDPTGQRDGRPWISLRGRDQSQSQLRRSRAPRDGKRRSQHQRIAIFYHRSGRTPTSISTIPSLGNATTPES